MGLGLPSHETSDGAVDEARKTRASQLLARDLRMPAFMLRRRFIPIVVVFTSLAVGGCDQDASDELSTLEFEEDEEEEIEDVQDFDVPGVEDDDAPTRTAPAEPLPEPDAGGQLAVDLDPQEGYWGGWQPIIQVKSGMCLDAAGTTQGTYVRQSYCHFSQLQQWKFLINPTHNTFQVQNQRSGLCLDNVYGYLTLQPCGGWNSQKWTTHDPSTPGLVAFESLADGECWDIPYGSVDPAYVNGSFPCQGSTNQQWTVVVPDNSYACGI